jgi:branched-chain amino acid aminotransferase
VGRDLGIEVREQVLRDEDLSRADEAFLTSTTRELVPIVQIGERPIGTGKPGRISAELLRRFRERAWTKN